MVGAFLAAFVGHFILVAGLYVWLTVLRARAVASGGTVVADYAHANADRDAARRVQRNLSNQFEAPLFAYFAAAILVALNEVGLFDVVAAWVFLAGRLIHSAVQGLTDNVRLRGQVFVINFAAIAALMWHVASIAAKAAL